MTLRLVGDGLLHGLKTWEFLHVLQALKPIFFLKQGKMVADSESRF